MKKIISYILLGTLLCTFDSSLYSREYQNRNRDCRYHNKDEVVSVGGCGYETCRSAPYLAATVLFAAIVVCGVIAVGVHNRSHSSHDHSSDDSS